MALPKITSHIIMSCDEWIKIPQNPIQRDTERHAAKAKHLLRPLPVHAVVSAARFPSGKLVKLDGHTRALLWERGTVPKPDQIEVHCYEVKTMEEAAELYKTFDSKEALETTPDKVSGALKGMGYVPQSGLIASGGFASAIRIAWKSVFGYAYDVQPKDVYEAINEFAAEIIAVDDLGMRKGQMKSGLLAAVMLSYRKHNDKVMPFWRAVLANAGTKSGGKMDGVQAIHEINMHAEGKHSGTAAIDLCGRALTAVELWLNDQTMTGRPRPINTSDYLDQKAKPKYKLLKKVKREGLATNGHAHAAE